MSSLIRSKRAEGSILTVEQLIGLVIAAIVILGFGAPLLNGLLSFFKQDEEQGTLEAFDILTRTIEATINTKTQTSVNYYITNGYKVVAFNKGDNYVSETCNKNNPAVKPQACKGMTCLALCGEDDEGCRTHLKEFYIFEDIDKIVAKDLDSNFGENDNFVLYGKCGLSAYKFKTIHLERKGNDIIITSKKNDIKPSSQ